MLRVYKGLEKPREHIGERVALLVNRQDPSKVEKTIYLYDAAYEADDDPSFREGDAGDNDTNDDAGDDDDDDGDDKEKGSFFKDIIVSEAMWRKMSLSRFNRQLFMRIMETSNTSLLSMAIPPAQKGVMLTALRALVSQKGTTVTSEEDPLKKKKKKKQVAFAESDSSAVMKLSMSELESHIFMPASANSTFRMTVAAMSGAGKSVLVGKFLKLYRLEHPAEKRRKKFKRAPTAPKGLGMKDFAYKKQDDDDDEEKRPEFRIYVISFKREDPAYENIEGLVFISVDDEFLTNPPTYEMFTNSCVCFDDVESLRGKYQEAALTLRDQIFKCGRKDEISIISIIHEMFDRDATKTSWSESEYVVVFPRADTSMVIKLLDQKFFMSKEDIQTIIGQKTRWVMIKRTHPRAIITPSLIQLLV